MASSKTLDTALWQTTLQEHGNYTDALAALQDQDYDTMGVDVNTNLVDGIAAPVAVNGGINGSVTPFNTDALNKYRQPSPVNPDADRITGGYDALSMKGAFGSTDANGFKNSGWAGSAYTIGKTAFDGYMAYQGLEETKKQNAANVEAKNIALARQQTDQNNKIAQIRRNNAMGLSGGGTNYNTVATVARNPYSVYSKDQINYG